jgi:signal transduction histidine kinase
MPLESDPADSGARSLRPRARILRTFGDELISSETVALVELVKNSYDADATRVLVRFEGPLEAGEGLLEVIDNGHGMSLETIQDAWMEPATLYRKRDTHSEGLRRRVLGEKGIGRFATSRLADELEVITRRKGDAQEVHVEFDWTAFDDPERYLDEIKARWWRSRPADIAAGGAVDLLTDNDNAASDDAPSHGTVLRMKRLRNTWDAEDFANLRSGLARLISPFERSLFSGEHGAFRIELRLPEGHEGLDGVVEPSEALDRPHYRLAGEISKDGRYSFDVKMKGTAETHQLTGQFVIGDGRVPTCGPIRLELRVWDRDASAMRGLAHEQGATVRDIRRDLDQAAGINIYRDAFRVFPYGEPRNDWLRLDIRRVNNPTLRLSNNQIVGYVLISADANPDLRDQTNREGLIDNQAFEDLRELITASLNELEQRRFRARRPPRGAKPEGIFTDFTLASVGRYARRQHPNDTELQVLIAEAERDLDRRVEEVQDVIARYRRLATLGQLIDTVLHDGRAPVSKIRTEAGLGLRDIERERNGKLVPRLGERLTLIRGQSEALGTVFQKIEPFGGRRRGRPRRVPLEGIIADAFAVLDHEIDRLGVKIELPKTETEVSVDAAELQEVIINLLQNSLYWLRGVDEDERRIRIRVRRHPDRVVVTFSDSGPGVKDEVADHIFDPYFSTKPNGVGLGLAIAGEIVSEYYAGSLELVEPSSLGGATFRITLRRRI